MVNQKKNSADAIELLHHVDGLITLGENRANIVAAGNAALLLAYSSTKLSSSFYSKKTLIPADWPLSFALVALFFSVFALFPQFSSMWVPWRRSSRSYFFGCIGNLKEDQFVEGYLKRDDEQHIGMILKAVHMRARKAKRKFTCLTIAGCATILQFVPIGEKI